MKIRKLETRQPWLCEVDGTTYVRTEIQWNDDRPNDVTWHLNEDQVEGKLYLTDEQLEKLFWENNVKTNTSPLVNIPNGDDFFKTNREPLEEVILKLKSESDLEPNTIYFSNERKEMLKLCPNGDIFVHGRLADNDKEVVDALREFLTKQDLI
jgi:hypothetical protein